MSYYPEAFMEEVQNFSNWKKAMVDLPVPKRKRFLASKIHKLKKILKLGSKSLANQMSFEQRQNVENDRLERCQNYENEELERKFKAMKECQYEADQNAINENWENWDCCYLCAGQNNFDHCQRPQPEQQLKRGYSSIAYVFLVDEPEPVLVKLRTAKIPGGVMWISYRPDVDIHPAHNVYSYTSSQIPQGQHPIMV